MARRLILPLVAIAAFAAIASALRPPPAPAKTKVPDLRGLFKADLERLEDVSEAARRNAIEAERRRIEAEHARENRPR